MLFVLCSISKVAGEEGAEINVRHTAREKWKSGDCAVFLFLKICLMCRMKEKRENDDCLETENEERE